MRITYKTEGVEFNESEQKGTQSVLIFLIRYLKARNILYVSKNVIPVLLILTSQFLCKLVLLF